MESEVSTKRRCPPGIACIAEEIAVAVCLRPIRVVRAVVACVPDEVAIDILLASVRHGGAVVASIAEPVGVAVGLTRICGVGTSVAGIAHAIRILVGLTGIGDARTVIGRIADAIRIDIAYLTGIASATGVTVVLAWIERADAAVDHVVHAVAVAVGGEQPPGLGENDHGER